MKIYKYTTLETLHYICIDLCAHRVLHGVRRSSPATSRCRDQLLGCAYRMGLQSRVYSSKGQLQLLLHCSQFPVCSDPEILCIHIIKPTRYTNFSNLFLEQNSTCFGQVFCLTSGCHPVAVVQYTFTHKQYTEQHKTKNTQNNTTIWESAG